MTNLKVNLISFFIIFFSLILFKFHQSIAASVKHFLYSPVDSYLSANIKFADGTHVDYVFARPSRMEIINNQVFGNQSVEKWNETAKLALRKVMFDQKYAKMPVEVKLFRHWNDVQLPTDLKNNFDTYRAYR